MQRIQFSLQEETAARNTPLSERLPRAMGVTIRIQQ